ncbi:MAG: DUF924 family protein [Steroidobacteraceae bacterium]
MLDYWFGTAPLDTAALTQRMQLWFAAGDTAELTWQLDETLRLRFGPLMQDALEGRLDAWASTPRRRLALILLLDQFPRNIHRGRAGAYAGDVQALPLALTGMQLGADIALTPPERLFFYMPLQHAESLEAQEESVAAFEQLMNEAPDEQRGLFSGAFDFARRHRDIIARFGRFPHRNAVLGRSNTPGESSWLASGGDTFGQ